MFKPNNEYQKALAEIESWTLHPQSAETHVDERIFGGAVSDRVFFVKTLAVPDEPNGTIDATLEFNPETMHAKNIGDLVQYVEDIGSGKLLHQRDQLRNACQLLVDSLEGKPIHPEEAIGAIRNALNKTGSTQ